MLTASNLRRALRSLGTTLADRGLRYHVAIVGGAALLLRDDHDRPTGDVDVAAVAEGINEPQPRLELPEQLRSAAADVARTLGLDDDWLNSGAVAHVGDKLPTDYLERTNPIVYDALTISVLGRQDLIRLKTYAATDEGPTSQHARDLATMHATRDERAEALAWVRQHTNQDPQLIDDLAIHFGIGT